MTARSPKSRLARAVGAEVRHQREALGLTQAQLGARVGKGAGDISRMENGRRPPQLATLVKVVEDGLGLTMRAFWPGVEVRRSFLRRAA